MREELFYQSRSQSFLLLMGTREAGLQGCYFHASLTYVLDKYCWRHMYHLVKKKSKFIAAWFTHENIPISSPLGVRLLNSWQMFANMTVTASRYFQE